VFASVYGKLYNIDQFLKVINISLSKNLFGGGTPPAPGFASRIFIKLLAGWTLSVTNKINRWN
jgi:hypothetical protein